jgi:hypothetical protein
MGRLLDDFLYRTSLFTVVRGKCRYDRHESVRLVSGEWWGEDSRSSECAWAPEDVCPVCTGAGFVELSREEAQLSQYDGADTADARRKPCVPCDGTGFVPGPHWPYRFPQPPPLRVDQ